MMKKTSETVTENIFRKFYKTNTFIEKSAIPKSYGFKSKRKSSYQGYPDFFKDLSDYAIVVEAKASNHLEAEAEVQFYMLNNKIVKDIIGIAISGQDISQIKATYYYKLKEDNKINKFKFRDKLVSLKEIDNRFNQYIQEELISNEELLFILKNLNEQFHHSKIRDTDRSLFFSGIMIALTNNNFRQIYMNISEPTKEERAKTSSIILDSYHLNQALLSAINSQLEGRVNSLSKEFSWIDKFSFIKNVDFSLNDYKQIIKRVQDKVYQPYLLDEKQDILAKAYKIFLKKAGKIDNKNIILTPDHIKELMIKLARLNVHDVIIDTCTGSGGFLMEAMEKLIVLAKENTKKIKNIKEKQLIGFETDSVLFALACSNMFLHGDGRTNLLFRSSLLDMTTPNDKVLYQYIKKQKATKCIINPPYEGNNPILFTKQAIDYLEPNGKLIIIMPTPTLIKNQHDITTSILDMARLDFVIKMPLNLFSEQGRTVNTSIFGFTKTPHEKNDNVIFYNLKNDGFKSIQHKGKVDKDNLWNNIENNIIDCINNSFEINGVCYKRKIYKDNNLVLSGNIAPQKKSSNWVKVSDLFDLEDGSLASSSGSDSGDYDFITAATEWRKHEEYTHDTEAIIYATKASGSLGRSHYVNGKFIASNLCLILTKKKNSNYLINLEFYAEYFSTIQEDIVSDLADGTSKLTIGKDMFNEYYIEYIPIAKQNSYVKKHLKKYKALVQDLNNEKLKAHKELLKILDIS